MSVVKKMALLITALLVVSSATGVFAVWNYASADPHDYSSGVKMSMDVFHFVEGDEEMVLGEAVLADRFIKEVNKMLDSPNSTKLDEIFDARQDRSWFTINELALDDPNSEGAQIRELLGIKDFPDLTIIIKFVSGNPGYELYTTRVDVDAVDENGNYVIPEEEFVNETTYIYPVNRTTFKSDGNGGYVADKVTVGYSRTIYYYDYANGSWGNSQSTKTRTYDVSTFSEGDSMGNSVEIESGIIGKEITVQNIDKEKTVYFKFQVPSRGKYVFSTTTPGLSGVICNSNGTEISSNTNLQTRTTYYLKLTYSAVGEPEHFKFTIST